MTRKELLAGGTVEVVDRALAAYNAHDHAALREGYDPVARTRRPGWPGEAGVDELTVSMWRDSADGRPHSSS